MGKHPSLKNAKGACPICQKPTQDPYAPFCSKRCADVDLGRWFSGSYTIAGSSSHPETLPGNGQETLGDNFYSDKSYE